MNGYAAEKSRSNVQNVHFFILFLNEWTSKCGIFTPHWSLEKPPEFERVWGGLCNNAKGKTFYEIDSITPSEYGLLLGTTPQTRIGRRTNYFFKYRIDATEQLYKAGKIKRILISGDENSLDGVNEVECMKDSLVAHGVDANDIILDGKGFRTLDAVVRAVKVYNIHSFVVISQRFHNERAIYLTEHLGHEVHDIQGYNAADPTSKMALMTYVREYFARVKVFVDILTGKEPATYEKGE